MESAAPNETLLDFDKAMYDFSIMFPKLSRSEIEEALRKNDGDVAKTIDDLLAVTEGWKLNTTTSSSSSTSHAKSSGLYRSQRSSVDVPSSSSHNQSRSSTGYTRLGRRIDRLSIEDLETERRKIEHMRLQNLEKLDKVTDVDEARLLEDEQLALLLQNKDIIRQMQREKFGVNPGRVSSCDRRSSSSTSRYEQGPAVPEGPLLDEMLILNSGGDIREKLKSMSKASKLRLSNLMANFKRRDDRHQLHPV